MTSQLTEDILESYRTEKMLAEQIAALQAEIVALKETCNTCDRIYGLTDLREQVQTGRRIVAELQAKLSQALQVTNNDLTAIQELKNEVYRLKKECAGAMAERDAARKALRAAYPALDAMIDFLRDCRHGPCAQPRSSELFTDWAIKKARTIMVQYELDKVDTALREARRTP